MGIRGWRENMGTEIKGEHLKTYTQKPQKPQKVMKKDKKRSFVGSVGIVAKNQKVKTLQDERNYIWDKAWNLAEWIDDQHSKVHWKERTKYVPEVFAMSARISELEKQIAQNQEAKQWKI